MSSTELADKLDQADARQKAGLETTPGTRDLFGLLTDMEPALRRAFPKTVDVGRFVRLAQTTLRTVPRLLECTPQSVMAGFMQAAQLGVEIDAVRGQAYLIPRKNGRTNTMEANFQLGYRGLIDIAGRSGVTVRVRAVREHDEFVYEDGLDPVLRHVPFLKGDRGEPFVYYSIASFADERPPEFLVMTRAEVEVVRDRFGAKKNGKPTGPWVDHFDAMAYKTVIIRQLNYMPLPVEVLDAIRDDEIPIDVRDTLERPALEAASTAEVSPAGSDPGPPAPSDPPEGTDDDHQADDEPAADPIAQAHIDAMAAAQPADEFEVGDADRPIDESVQQHAARLVVQLAGDRYEAWAAYKRKTGISSTPERWTDQQAAAVVAWVLTTPTENEEQS